MIVSLLVTLSVLYFVAPVIGTVYFGVLKNEPSVCTEGITIPCWTMGAMFAMMATTL